MELGRCSESRSCERPAVSPGEVGAPQNRTVGGLTVVVDAARIPACVVIVAAVVLDVAFTVAAGSHATERDDRQATSHERLGQDSRVR